MKPLKPKWPFLTCNLIRPSSAADYFKKAIKPDLLPNTEPLLLLPYNKSLMKVNALTDNFSARLNPLNLFFSLIAKQFLFCSMKGIFS